jgi:hypothetical protein
MMRLCGGCDDSDVLVVALTIVATVQLYRRLGLTIAQLNARLGFVADDNFSDWRIACDDRV